MADKEPYGDVEYADPGYQSDKQKRYPINSHDHVKAAWSYINKGDNASKYSSEQLAHIKGRIKAAAKKFGIDISDDSQKKEGRSDMTPERRYTTGLVELRAAVGENGIAPIGGYAAKFNKLSRNLGGFVEELTPGTFNRAAADNWPGVVCRYNHSDDNLLGTIHAGTLRLSIDGIGLRYDVDPPSSRQDVVELVQRRDVQFSSFAFRSVQDDWTQTDQGYPKRMLLSLELIDVAPVITPAYPDTTAGLRSLARKFDAELDEVRAMAERNELRSFFQRTDSVDPAAKEILARKAEETKRNAPETREENKSTFGPAARMLLLGRAKDPFDV
jgi:HK97 family phage prohead protease